MQSPLPRRSKGPSAIAAASAAVAPPGRTGAGAEDDSAPSPESEAAAPPMSEAAAAFVGEATATPRATPRSRAAEAKSAPTPPSPDRQRRLSRPVLLSGAAVLAAALIGGAAFVVTDDGGDGGSRSATSMPGGGLPDNARRTGPKATAPSGSGSASASASASTAPSASPSPGGTSASPKASATGSAKEPGAGAPSKPGPTTDAGTELADGPSCTSAAGSGPLTDYSACVSAGTVTFKVTFHAAKPFYHVFIDTDGNTGTGYQLPYPSPSALGADYMIENGGLYRSRSTDWSWTEASARPTRTVSGGTHTWVLPLSRIGSPTRAQRVEFHAGSDYTAVLTFTP
ncbi:hypothetical protein ACWCPF_00455 [Streptomyces sp. NPDC001858]